MAETKMAPAKAFRPPAQGVDPMPPIQRRAGRHDPRAQLRQNARFMAQMKAQQQAVQRKEDHLYGTGGPQMGQDRRGEAPNSGSQEFDHLRASIAKTSIYLRSVIRALEQYKHLEGVGRAASSLRGLLGRLSKLAANASGIGIAGKAIALGTCLTRILEARNFGEFSGACVDTGGHLLMGMTPLTAILDAVLTAVYGPDWPSKALTSVAQFLATAFANHQKYYGDRFTESGQLIIPAGPKKL